MTVLAARTGTPAPTEEALGHLVRAVCVVSARSGTAMHAMTVDSLAAVSTEPPRIVVGVRPESRWWALASASGAFAASVLSAGQEDVARWFASRRRGSGGRQFDGIGWRAGPRTGAPLLEGASAWLECHVEGVTRVADQVIVVGRVTDQAEPDPAPSVLLRVHTHYCSLG